jgi:hypothetical protein
MRVVRSLHSTAAPGPVPGGALISLSLLVVLLGSGCLTLNPANQVRANGEALRVDDDGALRQGNSEIDEQDFYAIAGDKKALAQVRNHRFDLITTQIAGQVAGAAGIGGIVIGGGTLAGGIVWTADQGPIGLLLLIPGALVLTGSIIAVPVGYAMAANAADELTTEYVLPRERASAAAKRYNARRR